MATCKDCLHFGVCKFKDLPAPLSDSYIRESECIEKRCGDFKDRSRFVELPCKVGDDVWVIDQFDNTIYHANVFTISMTFTPERMFSNLTIKKENGSVLVDNSLRDIGKTIFLSKEEAKQALKERESE